MEQVPDVQIALVHAIYEVSPDGILVVDPEHVIISHKAGMDAYVSKPIRPDDLFQEIGLLCLENKSDQVSR